MPMAVNRGEKQHADRQQTQGQIVIEKWLDKILKEETPQSAMKRKSDEIDGEEAENSSQPKKPRGQVQDAIEKFFRKGLFDPLILDKYRKDYRLSEPYKHAVIQELMDDSLLRNVRSEIRENVHFTPKETDIYKIHQSGDLANLDGLDDEALSKLPSLLKLRDALYSEAFRKYIGEVTGSGELSGRKTDMAINIYTPGCHLLCHDDVIGSRRLSYILYLTDPDIPWQAGWGGSLRLYPTTIFDGEHGEVIQRPLPDFSKTIPPVWNQLSFFAVQPGESFHDVEEVYHAANKEQEEREGRRIRMAISGWYHIPQFGEKDYNEGEASMQTDRSSLIQLQGKADRFDLPGAQPIQVSIDTKSREEEPQLEPHQYEFLLKYMSPTYLTPDTIMQVAEHFSEESSITLDFLLSNKFALRLRDYIEKQEVSQDVISNTAADSQMESKGWKVARPPHKHRFLYLREGANTGDISDHLLLNPLRELIEVFLPSPEFRWWLELATSLYIENHDFLARRFRRGEDYSLATSIEGRSRLEICLGLTPTSGWGGAADSDGEDEANTTSNQSTEAMSEADAKNSKAKAKAKISADAEAPTLLAEEADNVGGDEIYMGGDEDGDAGDAAIYRSSGDTEDANVLFISPPVWNKLSIVLRDAGTLKFVKYLSKSAPGDRWDVVGSFDVELGDQEEHEESAATNASQKRASGVDDEDDEDETDTETMENGSSWKPSGTTITGSSLETIAVSSPHEVVILGSSDEEPEFQGFQDSEESDSD